MKVKGWFGVLSVLAAILVAVAVASVVWDVLKQVKNGPLQNIGVPPKQNSK